MTTRITGDLIGNQGGNAFGNGSGGVILSTGAVNTTIGGTAAAARGNVISGNSSGATACKFKPMPSVR